MKILLIAYNWFGGTQEFCARAFEKLGHEVRRVYAPLKWQPFFLYNRLLNQVYRINRWKEKKFFIFFNDLIKKNAIEFRPDLLFTINEAYTYPETLKSIRDRFKIPIAVWLADNPFDSSRFSFLPISLQYFTHIFVGEPLWIPNIKMLAKTDKIVYLYGAADTDIFKSVPVTPAQEKEFSADVSYAGSAYGFKAEAVHRIAILNALDGVNLKIWGWGGWESSYRYFPNIRKFYQRRRLNFEEMNIMNQVSKIVLNIANPQCITAFQQRTFEIPASGGFQIADRRSEIDRILPEFQIDQFSTIDELKEMIAYYLDKPPKRREKIIKLQQEVINKHTYRHRMSEMLKAVFGS